MALPTVRSVGKPSRAPAVPFMLSRGDVAALFGVSASTISRWGREGKLPCVLTLGGQRRYVRDDVLKLLEGARRQSGHRRVRGTAM